MKNIYMLFLSIFIFCQANGQNWIIQNSPDVGPLNAIHFPTATIGYSVLGGDGVIKTIDGGSNWTKLPYFNSQILYSVFFVDANTGYAVGDSIYKTTDGGINWVMQNSGTSDQWFYSVFFLNETTGFVGGSTLEILKTTDGGITWNSKNNGSSVFFRVKSIYFPSSTIGYAVGDSSYKTTDGGETWSPISVKGSSVFFTDVNTGYIAGESGYIAKTIDGGQTWTSLESNTGGDLTGVYFVTGTTGYIVGDNIILKTINGGNEWTSMSFSPTRNLSSVFFINENLGFTCGDHGSIYKYANGTGITSIQSEALQMYPNPTTGKFIVQTSFNVSDASLSIVNGNGQEVKCMKINQQNNEIDITNLPDGIYSLKYTGQNTVATGKIIKVSH